MGGLRLLFYLVPLFAAACTMSVATAPEILLFNGRGTSPNDEAALESTLRERRSSYSTANSERLDGMSEAEFKATAS